MSASKDILDLRLSGELLLEDAKWMTCNATRIIDLYNLLVENLVKENDLTELHLLLNVSCRNSYQSSILDCLFRLELLKFRLCEKASYSKILIDKIEMEKPVQDLLTKYGLVETPIVVVGKTTPIAIVILKNILKSTYGMFNDLFWSRLYMVKKRPSSEIVFVDSFMFSQSVDANGNFADRYYTGYEENLSKSEIEKLWFAPTLANIKTLSEYRRVFSNISKCNSNLLIQESWLSAIDYLTSIKLSLSIPRKVCRLSHDLGHDLGQLVINESRLQIGSFSLVKAINKYRFIQRISEASIDIAGVVDWNENQVVDRALNLGFKAFYPAVHVRGYQCFMVPKYYACAEPKEFEKRLGTLPHSYHVFGESAHAATASVRQFMDLELSPAFRFSYLYGIQRKRSDPAVILFAMPIFLDESQRLMDMCALLLAESDETYEIIIKIHPSVSLDEFKKTIPAINTPRIKLTDLGMAELLPTISVLVSATSSVCSEAALIGIPVAILGNPSGPAMNPIPASVSEESWAICYSLRDLQAFLGRVKNIDNREIALSEIIQPVSTDGVKQLFLFSRDEDTV